MFEYRQDGWPLCPSCGEDELWSAETPPNKNGPMHCYACNWRGHVPLHVEVNSKLDVGPDIPGGGEA